MGKVRKQTGDRKGSIPRKGCVGGPRAPSRFQGFLVHGLVSLRGSSRAFCRQHLPQGRGTRSQADVTTLVSRRLWRRDSKRLCRPGVKYETVS